MATASSWPGPSSSRCRTRSSRTSSSGPVPSTSPRSSRRASGPTEQPPILLYSDPERLLEHLGDTLGIEAVLGMAEVAAWAEAPARAIGRFDVRRPPRSLDEMWACAANEAEREAIRTAMFGSVMDVVDRFLPGQVQARAGAQHAELPGRQLHLPGPLLTGQRPVPRLCPGVARDGDDVQGPGRPGHHRRASPGRSSSGTGASCDATRRSRGSSSTTEPSEASTSGTARWRPRPVVVSNLDPTATFTQLVDPDALPEAFARRVDGHRPQGGLLPGPLRAARAARVPRPRTRR